MKAVPIGVPVQGIAGLLLAAAVLSTATGWANESDATAVAAATEVELATQVITGVKESPQVLYLMPWREFGPPSALAAPPVISAANVFERLDPAAQSRARRYEALLLLRSTVEEKPESAALGGGISAGR